MTITTEGYRDHMVITDNAKTIHKIKGIIEEYADCREEMDSQKVAVEIYCLMREDHDIAANMRDYWKCLADKAER